MPGALTKSRLDYTWGLAEESTRLVRVLKLLHRHAPRLDTVLGSLPTFAKAVENWFNKRVLKDAVADGEVT